MDTFTIVEAKEKLAELVERAARGEDVRIVDPVGHAVDLKAVQPPRSVEEASRRVGRLKGKRQLGHLTDKMTVPARLMEPMDADELRDWYGDDA